MKSLGANNGAVITLFLSEAGLLALGGGILGFVLGAVLAQHIGIAVFSSRVEIQPVLFPVVLLLAVLVTFVGSIASIRRALTFDPAVVLRETRHSHVFPSRKDVHTGCSRERQLSAADELSPHCSRW